MAGHRNLVLSPVGDESLHPTWLSAPDERQFDLGLIYFGSQGDRYRDEAEYYLRQRGFKFHLLDALMTQMGPRLAEYDYIWCPDDDLASNTADVNRMFSIAREFRLAISQPAVAEGEVSHATVRQQPGLLLRYSQFVEVMCPVFSREALARVRSTLVANKSAWGVDWAWTRLIPAEELAIIDAVGVHHTRPLQSGKGYDRMRELGVNPLEDLVQMSAQYGVSKRRRRQIKKGRLRVRAVTLDGATTWVGPRWWQLWQAAS